MNSSNKKITFKGQALKISGTELKVGDVVPSFKLTANDMSDLSSEKFKGKALLISVVPSLDTPVCSVSTKRFNQEASRLAKDLEILTVSRDTPFAQKRWCGAEGVNNLTTASDYKYRTFGESFGVLIDDWQLLARAVFLVNKQGKISYLDYVSEVSSEPDYDALLKEVAKLTE